MTQSPPTNIRLTSNEEAKVEAVRLLLMKKLVGMYITKSHAINALKALHVEIGSKK